MCRLEHLRGRHVRNLCASSALSIEMQRDLYSCENQACDFRVAPRIRGLAPKRCQHGMCFLVNKDLPAAGAAGGKSAARRKFFGMLFSVYRLHIVSYTS